MEKDFRVETDLIFILKFSKMLGNLHNNSRICRRKSRSCKDDKLKEARENRENKPPHTHLQHTIHENGGVTNNPYLAFVWGSSSFLEKWADTLSYFYFA